MPLAQTGHGDAVWPRTGLRQVDEHGLGDAELAEGGMVPSELRVLVRGIELDLDPENGLRRGDQNVDTTDRLPVRDETALGADLDLTPELGRVDPDLA
jgi:hypothetical protein